MYTPVLVASPTSTPVTLDEAKEHLRVDYSEDDTLISALIDAAVSYLDGWTGILSRCLCQQTWRQDFNAFCLDLDGPAYARFMRVPLYPVISITSVKYDDINGVEQTVNSNNYELLSDDLGAFVRFVNTYAFPAVSNEYPSVRITYLAGYADVGGVSTVPQAIKNAILLLIGHWYANREAAVVDSRAAAIQVPFAVDALLAAFRRSHF